MGYCLEPLSDPESLEDRARAFLEDRGSDALTGPRRFGRSRLVGFVGEVAEGMGMKVWTVGSDMECPDVVILDHWSELDGCSDIIASNPGADVLFGQDLCHQVPAVVRHRLRDLPQSVKNDLGCNSFQAIAMEVTIEKFNPWKDSLVSGILLLILGILLAVFQSEALSWIIIIAGVFMLIGGLLAIFDAMRSKFTPTLVMGVVMVVVGIAFILLDQLIEDIAMILLALGLIIVGLISLLGIGGGFAVAKGSRAVTVIIGVILIVLGVVAFMNLDGTADVVMIIIGVMMAVSGLLNLYQAYQLNRISK